jgi:threonine dehydratase
VSAASRLSLERIAAAAAVIDPVFLNSPQFLAETLSDELGCRLVVKVETLNPIRSFKGRGTDYLAASLTGRPHLVCTTAGNFGQGMAFAARKRGLSVTVFAAETANPRKVERMRALGADVRLHGEDFDAAHLEAQAFARENGAQLVEDGRDAAIAEGAGTIGIELLRWLEPFDAILVPLGDGSLLAGIARWVKAHQPATRMIGVCASGSPAFERSWRSGTLVDLGRSDTIADGLAVSSPFPEALEDLAGRIDDILLVEDPAMVEAMRRAHQEIGVVLEPSGAASLAAILTGSNITAEQMREWYD